MLSIERRRTESDTHRECGKNKIESGINGTPSNKAQYQDVIPTHMIATRAKMFSTCFPLPSKARPRMQCPIISCNSFSEGVSNSLHFFSSD